MLCAAAAAMGGAKKKRSVAATPANEDSDAMSVATAAKPPPRGRGRGAQQTRLTAGSLKRLEAEPGDLECGKVAPKAKKGKVAAKCLECGKTQDQASFVDGIDDACESHFQRYQRGFTNYGSFSSFMQQKQTDKKISQDWAAAGRHIGGHPPDWLPTDVVKMSGISCEVSRSMVAPTRAQLKELLGIEPERIGIKLQDLPDSNMGRFRGLLIPNPMMPFTQYKFKQQIGLTKQVHCMPADQQCYSDQADLSYDFMRDQIQGEKEDIKTLLTKIRTAPWNLEDLVKKSCEARSVPVDAANCSQLAVLLSGGGPSGSSTDPPLPQEDAVSANEESQESEEEEENEPSEEGEENVNPPASVRTRIWAGRLLNPRAVLEGVTVGAASCGQGRTFSETDSVAGPRNSPREKKEDGLPLTDVGKDNLVQRRTSALNLDRALAGANMGREARWIRDTRDLFQTKADARADILQRHLDLYEHCEKLASQSLVDMPQGRYEVSVRELQDNSVEFGPDMQRAMWKRGVAAAHALALQPPHNIKPLLSCLLPWPMSAAGNEDGGVVGFDGLRPQLAHLEMALDERSNMFVNHLKDLFVAVLKMGEPGGDALLSISRGFVSELQEVSLHDDAEAYDAPVSAVERTAKGLVALGDPMAVSSADDLEYVESIGISRSKEAKGSIAYAVYATIKSTPHYYAKLKEFNETKAATKALWPAMQRFGAAMQHVSEAVSSGVLEEALMKLGDITTTCRAGTFEPLVKSMEAALASWLESLNLHRPCYADGTLTGVVATAKKLVTLAEATLPASAAVWKQHRGLICTVEAEVSKLCTTALFDSLLAKASETLWSDPEERGKFHAALGNVINSDIIGSETQAEGLGKVAEFGLAWAGSADITYDDLAAMSEVCKTMKAAALLPQDARPRVEAFVDVVEHWRGTDKSYQDLLKLGADHVARLEAKGGCDAMRDLLGNLATLQESHGTHTQLASEAIRPLENFVQEMVAYKNEAQVCFADLHVKPLEASYAAIVEVACGGASAGSSWTDDIPENAQDDTAEMFKAAEAAFGRLDGPDFKLKLKTLNGDFSAWVNAHALFGVATNEMTQSRMEKTIAQATVTMQSALMVLAHSENSQNANPSKLRRDVRRHRAPLVDLQKEVQPALWAWSLEVAPLGK